MNEKEYAVGLELYAHSEKPNRVLLADLRKGYSDINALYLAAVLKKLPKATAPVYDRQQARAAYAKPVEVPALEAADKVLIGLGVRIKDLFTERNRLSNSFERWGLSESFKKQRADISLQIELVQRDIERVLRQRSEYLDSGIAPDDAETDSGRIPSDPYARMKKFKNMAIQISNIKQEARKMATYLAAEGLTERQIGQDERMIRILKRLDRAKLLRGELESLINAETETKEVVV